jgi:hypothetical protein
MLYIVAVLVFHIYYPRFTFSSQGNISQAGWEVWVKDLKGFTQPLRHAAPPRKPVRS